MRARAICALVAASAALVSIEACGADDDAVTPPPFSSDGGPTDPPRSDAASDGSTTIDAGPPPPEPKALFTLAEPTAARAYGVSAVPGTRDILVVGPDDFQADAGNRSALALRTDLDGTVKWAKRLAGDSNDQFLSQVLVGDTLHALGITRTVYPGMVRNTDVLWAQIDATTGQIVGSRHFGTVENDDLFGVTPVGDGLVVIGSTGTNADAYVAKLGSNNAIAWAKRWATAGTESLRAIQPMPGGLVVVGFSTLAVGGKLSPVITKIDEAGTHQWSRAMSGFPDEALFMTVRPVGDGIIAGGQMRKAAGAPMTPFAVKLSLDGSAVTWAKVYESAGAGSWRSMVSVLADPAYGLPETVAVGGFSGSDVAIAKLSVADGSVVRSARVKSPSGATLALDRDVVWEREDKGLGLLFYATPPDAGAPSISSIGVALTNRLLELPEACAWTSAPAFTAADVAGITSTALTPSFANIALAIGDNGNALPASDVAFAATPACR